MELNERHQIKRKYGQYEAKRINASAPVRDSIVSFVGKRFVTEEELKSHLEKLSEQRGGTVNGATWFRNNQKYFESFTNRGQQVVTLSKYGKRVLEFILSKQEEQKLNEEDNTPDTEPIDEGFSFLVKANNEAAKTIVRTIQKQVQSIGEKQMEELLGMIFSDFRKGGSKGLDSYIK